MNRSSSSLIAVDTSRRCASRRARLGLSPLPVRGKAWRIVADLVGAIIALLLAWAFFVVAFSL